MMAKTWWMTPEQMAEYERLSKHLRELGEEHRKLMEKVKGKTIDVAEATRLREVIKDFNDTYEQRRELEEKNPVLPKNLVADLED